MSGTLLVTGASGFVGRHVAPALAAAGWTVRAAARDQATVRAAPGVTPAAMPDLAASQVDWRPLLAGVTHVVHLAGLAHMTAAIPETTYMAINASATRALAEAATAAGIARIVLVSSIRAQTGPVAAGIVRETDQPRPTDAYGRSKLRAEQDLWDALLGSGTAGVVLRPVLVYGPGVKGNLAALSKLARLAVPLPLGALNNRRSLVSLGNLTSAIAHALTSPAVTGGTYLIADDTPVGVADILAAMRKGIGRRPGLFPIPMAPFGAALKAIGRGAVWDRLAGDLVADTSALRATGWAPPEATHEALAASMRA